MDNRIRHVDKLMTALQAASTLPTWQGHSGYRTKLHSPTAVSLLGENPGRGRSGSRNFLFSEEPSIKKKALWENLRPWILMDNRTFHVDKPVTALQAANTLPTWRDTPVITQSSTVLLLFFNLLRQKQPGD